MPYYKAKETTEISWGDFAGMNGIAPEQTRERYVRMYREMKKMPSSVPFGKLEQYEQKYTWKPKIETKKSVEAILYEMEMYNGESERIYHEYKGDNPYEKRAVPKLCSFIWQKKPNSAYQINIYFKEDDIYKAFEALGKEDNSMDLILDLDNESEFKKIYLSNSKEKYVLDPEKIKYYPSNGNDYDPKIQTIIKD